MPRSIFYELVTNAIKKLPGHLVEDGELLIPCEDTAEESNWPRFGDRASAYTSNNPIELLQTGNPQDRTINYIQDIANYAENNSSKMFLIMSMNPRRGLPVAFCHRKNVIVAYGNLAQHERQLNKKTISLPALPMTLLNENPLQARERKVLISFQGAASHNCRKKLFELNNDDDIIIRNPNSSSYSGKIDILSGIEDISYSRLLDDSVFGIVARGDANFSYRLLETMSKGAIPIIISDGWILPFDNTIDWDSCSLRFSQDSINEIPSIVEKIDARHLFDLQVNVISYYRTFFRDIDSIVKTMLKEAFEIIKYI